jgi:hypothetical protein
VKFIVNVSTAAVKDHILFISSSSKYLGLCQTAKAVLNGKGITALLRTKRKEIRKTFQFYCGNGKSV